jgi:hypothetical protein
MLVTNVFGISPLLVWREMTLEEAQISDTHSLKGVLVAGFIRPYWHYKWFKMTWGDNKVNYRRNHQKKCSKFLSFFLSIFFKMNSKNYVRFNLTTKTSKYHLDVNQLSDQCFSGLLIEKSKHIPRKR